MPCIEFEKVSYTYDGDTYVLTDIDLAIEQGEFVCILGGNGSGKSTLAKHINALLVPDVGRVSVMGYDTRDSSLTYLIRSQAGMVFQNPDDQIVASLVENDVAFGPENLRVSTEELLQRVSDALAAVGLQGFEKRETSALSGGQKQRVAIAGAFAMQPAILVLDEASAMLDPRGRKGLMRICRKLNESGMTIVMITHFMEEAACADRVIVLDAGRIALSGSPEEILVQHDVLADLHLEMPFAADLAYRLRERGIDLTPTVEVERLEEQLCALHSKG